MGRTRIDYIAAQLEYQRNILETFSRATATQIVEGKNWYTDAKGELWVITGNAWTLEQRSAVCAILSPRITWKSNLEGVRRLFQRVADGSVMMPTIAGVRRNVDKAWQTANDGNVSRVSGPKVSAFYANLCGDLERVTIDVWAARAAGVPDSAMSHLDRTRYGTLEKAYQSMARELGFAPAELQAICWIVQRGHGEGTMAGTKQARWNKGE